MDNIANEYSQPVIHAQNENQPDVRLTSSELANLWASWMESSMKECIIKYFLNIVDDREIIDVLEYTLGIAEKHLKRLTQLYQKESHPIPQGFTDGDVNLDAPRLFTDAFILSFLLDLAKARLDGYSTALQMATRADVRKYFTECIADPVEILNRTVNVMLSKGIYLRPPFIPMPERVDFTKKQSYLTGYFGKKRPLTSISISHLFEGLQRNSFRESLLTAFSQVAQSDQVRRFMQRGKQISDKQIQVFSSLLMEDGLPVSLSWDSGSTDSNIAPFSDKLMMGHVRASTVVLIGEYGKAISADPRHDLNITFSRLIAEAGKYAEDGINIMIDNRWFEEPPQSIGRNILDKKLH
ncbi:MAG: DUF3231 family protein [Desulfocucumaceae bacterium]